MHTNGLWNPAGHVRILLKNKERERVPQRIKISEFTSSCVRMTMMKEDCAVRKRERCKSNRYLIRSSRQSFNGRDVLRGGGEGETLDVVFFARMKTNSGIDERLSYLAPSLASHKQSRTFGNCYASSRVGERQEGDCSVGSLSLSLSVRGSS